MTPLGKPANEAPVTAASLSATQIESAPSPTLPEFVRQPGPVTQARYWSVATALEDIDFELGAGISLDVALAQKIKSRGLAGAYISIVKAEMAKMEYVIPATSPDDDHVAWYSETHSPEMPGRIEDAGVICGWLSQKAFYHCHGLWSDARQVVTMGHLLPETCILSKPARVTGFGFRHAFFDRQYDRETNFDLFVPEQLSPEQAATALPDPSPATPDHQGILLRIAPNTQIDQPLIDCCRNAGWQRASVHGVGSLIGAHFDDGRIMNSYATEFLIESGTVDLSGTTPHVGLDIVLVGLDGTFMRGRLAPADNPVLITSEIILRRQQ